MFLSKAPTRLTECPLSRTGLRRPVLTTLPQPAQHSNFEGHGYSYHGSVGKVNPIQPHSYDCSPTCHHLPGVQIRLCSEFGHVDDFLFLSHTSLLVKVYSQLALHSSGTNPAPPVPEPWPVLTGPSAC